MSKAIEDLTTEEQATFRSEIGAQATIADGDLSIAKTNGLQTALDSKTTDSALGDIAIIPTGLVSDAKLFDSAAINSGSATLATSTGGFVSEDVGKIIRVRGAGAAGADLVTTISAVGSQTSITLAANASTSVTGAQGVYGTDNSTAIQTALTSAYNSTTRKTVFIPAGRYLCNVLSYSGVKMLGSKGLEGQSPFNRINFNNYTGATTLVPILSSSACVRYETATGAGSSTIERILFVAGDGTLDADRVGTAVEVGEPLNTADGAVAAAFSLRNCEINGFKYGATFSRMWDSFIEGVTVNYCDVGFFCGEMLVDGTPSPTGPADGMVFTGCTSNHTNDVFHMLGSKSAAVICGDYNNMDRFMVLDSSNVSITGINLETCPNAVFHLLNLAGPSSVSCSHIQSTGVIGIGCVNERASGQSLSVLSSTFTFVYKTVGVGVPVNLPAGSVIERYTDNTFTTKIATEFWDVISRRRYEYQDYLKLDEYFCKTNSSPYGNLGWVASQIAGSTALTGQEGALSLYQDAASEAVRLMPESSPFSFYANWRMVWRFRFGGGQTTTVFRMGLYSIDGTAAMIPANGIGLRADTVTEGDTTLKLEVIVSGVKQTAVDTGIALSSLSTRSDLVLEKRGSNVYLSIRVADSTNLAGNQVIYSGTLPNSSTTAAPAVFLSGSAAQLLYLQRMTLERTP